MRFDSQDVIFVEHEFPFFKINKGEEGVCISVENGDTTTMESHWLPVTQTQLHKEIQIIEETNCETSTQHAQSVEAINKDTSTEFPIM